jgi:CRISPR-associated protein (TIGR03984 family)
MKREIKACREVLQMLDVPAQLDPAVWLAEQAGDTECYLLAHADDGLIWGKVVNGILNTSHDAARNTGYAQISPPLREVTLQTARLFNNNGEILLWRDSETLSWRARMIYVVNDSQEATFVEAIDERQLLWGNQVEALSDTFTLLSDSGQGLRHIAPISIATKALPLRLRVRHLISEDDTGFARVTASRLVNLEGNHE